MSERDFVQSLARGLAVIRAFDANHTRLSLSEVAARTDIPRAAARRFLHTLEELGYVRQVARTFSLTPRVLELGHSYLSALSLPDVVHPHLERLSHRLGESASAAVLDGTDIVYVARVPMRRIMSVDITIGTRFPAHATSMGRVLLASLPDEERAEILDRPLASLTERTIADPAALADELVRIRQQGFAIVDGELEEGVRSVAVPLRGRGERVIAAMNVSTSAARVTRDELMDAFLPALRGQAKEADAELTLV
ncbi:IclR family transcriptional regulator domain-containing protein [Microbacterium amylolyticum]|uniref:IclR family pca regulon transcriptional regulator n=1 Tax=Microbacterium amylolyticum TaxID=936337 RepID=A0ABS4ZHG2_9MICO|nr:IclR family transcriptional regulator C-terminal domain-containing protein [Microbacterium amylolyticum]MBP2436717.1 IclR family pca regulon transcriptional regulator [Microbacterium amylolyticum]